MINGLTENESHKNAWLFDLQVSNRNSEFCQKSTANSSQLTLQQASQTVNDPDLRENQKPNGNEADQDQELRSPAKPKAPILQVELLKRIANTSIIS